MQSARRPWTASFIFAFFLFSAGTLARAQQTSELHGGRWVDVAIPTTQEAPIDPQLLRIEQMIRDRQFNNAKKSATVWLRTNKNSPVYDRGIYLMAEALYQYGDRMTAFYYLDELLDEYPASPLFYQSLERQFQIADDYLNGYKRRLLLMPIFGAEEEAVEMLYRIQQRSPKSPIAEKALLRTADYYYADAQYDLAEDAYHVYAESYPRSPYTPRVRLREAYANLAQFRGLRFDSSSVVDAKSQLQGVINTYPDLAREENLPEVLVRIDNTFARKLAVTGDFYRRTRQPQAAAYTYEYLLKNFGNSSMAPEAEKQLQQLQRKLPAPIQGQPATMPVTSSRD